MLTTVNLPDSLYEKSVALADAKGETVEQIIVEALSKSVVEIECLPDTGKRVQLPVIRSKRPGTLDLTNFDFDDLLT